MTGRFTPQDRGVRKITDVNHLNYPNYVKITKYLPDGYMARIHKKGPLLFFRKDQLSPNRFYPESQGVWIQDFSHPYYPNRVKILEVLPEGYKVEIHVWPPMHAKQHPIEILKEDQLSDDLIGG